MSLGYLGRLCLRAAQAAVRRAEHQKQPATSRQAAPSPPSHHQPPAGRVNGGLAGPAARTAEAEVTAAAAAMRMRRRRAEKDEGLMNLVCWGPN